MAVIQDPIDPTRIARVKSNKAILTTTDEKEILGSYRLSVFSGLTTGVIAGGDLFQFRWTDPDKLAYIKNIHVKGQVITGFTAAQELAFDVVQLTGFNAAGTGGTQIVPSATSLMKRTNMPQSLLSEARIATTTALGIGTKTPFGSSLLSGVAYELAAAATVQKGAVEAYYSAALADKPCILAVNEGILLRNTILMGAGGTVRWLVEIDWDEVNPA